jgi:hypothetical protein
MDLNIIKSVILVMGGNMNTLVDVKYMLKITWIKNLLRLIIVILTLMYKMFLQVELWLWHGVLPSTLG